ncbi:MAG: hypothetical protein JKY65_01290 [Planctomycetes bacterium]|nr:hypothetical protein [Planctomycetota bacterium]
MVRRLEATLLLLTAFSVSLLVSACGNSSSGSAPSAATAGLTSTTITPTVVTSTTTAAIPSALAPPFATLLQDESYVPSGPDAAVWYGRRDDPATPRNEAAQELAFEMAGNGVDAQFLEDHFTQGGALAIFVSGAGHERDTPTRRSGWMRPYASYVQASLGIPAIQVDYHDWAAGNDAKALAIYAFSLRTGVGRTHALIEKARSAGVGEIRLYGHSKGGDVVQEVTWGHAGDPLLVQAVVLGIPIWSAANPGSDGRHGYGGLFRYGVKGNRDYQGKLVVFIRYSDRAARGEMLPASTFPGPAHEYKFVLGTAGFPERLDAVRFQEAIGFSDREAGLTFDY